MAFCANCGTQATGSFCPNCGTSLGGGGRAPGGGAGAEYVPPATASGLTPNLAALICYLLGILGGIIFLLIEPYNRDPFVRFHAFQSIFFTLAYIASFIVLGILGAFTHGVLFLLSPLVGLLFFAAWIYMMVTAYQGKKVILPVIGEIALKQA